jgi:trehalose/maltose hydrolase-like predicted phosphorylase
MGVMAGTLDLVQRIYLGAEIRDGIVYFAPRLAGWLDGLSLPMQFHGTPFTVTVNGAELTVEASASGFSQPISVGVEDDVRELGPGDLCTFVLPDRRALAR